MYEEKHIFVPFVLACYHLMLDCINKQEIRSVEHGMCPIAELTSP